MPIPSAIEPHIEFNPGEWRCRELPIRPDQVVEHSDREMQIELGPIEVDFDACRLPRAWKEGSE